MTVIDGCHQNVHEWKGKPIGNIAVIHRCSGICNRSPRKKVTPQYLGASGNRAIFLNEGLHKWTGSMSVIIFFIENAFKIHVEINRNSADNNKAPSFFFVIV